MVERHTVEELRAAQAIGMARSPAAATPGCDAFERQPGVLQLMLGQLIAGGGNVLIIGPPEAGTTHLAIELGRAGVVAGHRALFANSGFLLGALSDAAAQGQLAERIALYCQPRLLIVDDFGPPPGRKQGVQPFLQLLEGRAGKGSTILTTRHPVTQWGTILGDGALAAAATDLILRRAFTVVLPGERARQEQARDRPPVRGRAPPRPRRSHR